MNLSEHFTLDEATFSSTARRLGIDNKPTDDVLQNMLVAANGMELVRSFLGYAVHVDSWLRVLLLNRAIGSADTSDHVKGYAVDFICPAFGTPLQICEALMESGIKYHKLIWEGSWVHISFNPLLQQLDYTAHFGKTVTYTQGIPS